MKKVSFFIMAILVSVFLLQTASEAAWIHGVIKSVDPVQRIVTIERANAEEQEAYAKELPIKILENAKLKNISSLNELKSGQEVKLDARANKEQGFWDANYIELIDSDAGNPPKASNQKTY